MTRAKQRTPGGDFARLLERARATLRRAERNRHSLSGGGYYARAYLEKIAVVQAEGQRFCVLLETNGQSDGARVLRAALGNVSSGSNSFDEAATQLSRLRTIWYSNVRQHLTINGSERATGAYYFPPDLRHTLPNLFGHTFDQVQGCFSFEFWDAQLVMLRKLVEGLIIDAYEKAGRKTDVMANGNYIPFGDLVGKAKSGALFSLSRDSKSALDSVKQLGDNAAHNPRFIARRSDVEKIQHGSRILLEDLATNIQRLEAGRPRLLTP